MTLTPQIRRIAVVDLGTLSLRFDVFEIASSDAPPKSLHKHRATPRLGDDLYHAGRVSKATREKLLQEFVAIKQKASELGVEKIIAVGTSALREDPESALLVSAIERETEISLRLVSGIEEAELTALGILSYETLPAGNPALVDIGGGSTEVTLCRDSQPRSFHSFQVGASRILQQFGRSYGDHILLPGERVQDVVAYLNESFAELIDLREKFPADFVVSSSGAARALERLVPAKNAERLKIHAETLKGLISGLIGKSPAQLLQIPGMEASRLDVILPGALALERTLELLGGKFIILSTFSLRHGVLLEQLKKSA